jgi:GGDEF domain-containing protein
MSEGEMRAATRRLEEMAEAENGRGKRAYLLRFTVGIVTAGVGEDKSLDELIAGADLIMYEQKREKKAKARSGLLVSPIQGDARGGGDSGGRKPFAGAHRLDGGMAR